MIDAIVARADGIPLYLEELTRTILEPGMALRVEEIPATLADSLMARLDRLSGAKEVAQRASVLGREFSYPLLAAVVGMEEAELRQGLARLDEAEILFVRGEPPRPPTPSSMRWYRRPPTSRCSSALAANSTAASSKCCLRSSLSARRRSRR